MSTSHIPRLHKNKNKEFGTYWLARWRNAEGKWKSLSLGNCAKVSHREAKLKLQEIIDKHARTPAARDVGKAPSIAEWGVKFAEFRNDLKPGSAAMYAKTFDYLSRHFNGETRLDRITPGGAEDFGVWLAKQPVIRCKPKSAPEGQAKPIKKPPAVVLLSKATVARHIRNCKVIFGRAIDRNLLTENPFRRVSGASPVLDKDWQEISVADLDRILEKCPSNGWRALFALARLAGLRRGEALRLQWGDIDWQEKTISVRAEANARGKREEGTKQRARVVPIEPRLYTLLRGYYDDAPEGAVLVCPVGPNNIDRDARVIVKHAGLPVYSKPFHSLRKVLESTWLSQHPAMTVCAWLGHSPAVAAKHYHRPTAGDMARVTGPAEQPGDELAQARAQLAAAHAEIAKLREAAADPLTGHVQVFEEEPETDQNRPSDKAGEGIRTLDVQLGRLSLYH